MSNKIVKNWDDDDYVETGAVPVASTTIPKVAEYNMEIPGMQEWLRLNKELKVAESLANAWIEANGFEFYDENGNEYVYRPVCEEFSKLMDNGDYLYETIKNFDVGKVPELKEEDEYVESICDECEGYYTDHRICHGMTQEEIAYEDYVAEWTGPGCFGRY